MKISVNQDDSFQLEQVYLPITLVTDDKEEMTIVMRDSGFEFKYQGDWYEAKNGKVELIKKTMAILDGVLSQTNLK
jgi:hypothetical protein